MYDYQSNMDYFQKQLDKEGITIDEFDIGNYIGLTYAELQSIVNSVIQYKKTKKQ